MPSLTTRLVDGFERVGDVLALAFVPVVTALLQTDKVRAVLAFDGVHVGFSLGSPIGVVDVWTFVDPPSRGATVSAGVPVGESPLSLALVPVALAVNAALAAGYFGSIGQSLVAGSYDFAANVREHFRPFLVLNVVPALLFLPFAVLGIGAGPWALAPVVVLLIPVSVAAAYLFAATPYLVVLRGVGVVDAARASYGFATDGGPYLRYVVGFALVVLAASPVASVVVVSVPIVGLVVGLGAAAVAGLAANVATMRFVADLDPESPAVGPWPERTGD
ncbi:hypothetical protein [Haloarcula litorea]|uniref:hypothetical protein n=1 Tax=Haloarcula litorea TaxID=3032579 RepID=UPI0023E7E839|nr:hypothetical protein [Halomicroarcula sp. GDY20]